MSVFDQKDTINEPIIGDLDIAGWDLRKTLSLLHKGNAVVHEWLNSPVVYREDVERRSELSAFAKSAFNPLAAFSHYFYMSRNKLESLGSEPMSGKAFLYGLRTLLCARWIMDFNQEPPMEFGVLTRHYVRDPVLGSELATTLAIKREGREAETAYISSELAEFTRQNLADLEQAKERIGEGEVSAGEFDRVFRMLIN